MKRVLNSSYINSYTIITPNYNNLKENLLKGPCSPSKDKNTDNSNA